MQHDGMLMCDRHNSLRTLRQTICSTDTESKTQLPSVLLKKPFTLRIEGVKAAHLDEWWSEYSANLALTIPEKTKS